ncbi:MAG: OsmC family protein [Rhodospirillaceae bacterium]|nr:OsmC family protein [Rhodospirillaceae bacterium]
MPSERFTFTGHDGSSLAARLDLPDGPVRAQALFAHCFTCGKDIFAANRIAETLAGRGIAVLRFDFTGLGSSEGEFANTDFTSNIQDLLAAATHLREVGRPASLLIGHSLGGAAVIAAAGELPEVKAVATIGAPADPGHVSHLFAHAREEIAASGSAEVSVGGRPFRIGAGFLDDIAEQPQEERLHQLHRALLVCHAPGDDIVGIDNASKIFLAARHPKSFVSLDTADHLLSNRADAAYAADVIAAWAGRYLPQPAAAELEAPAALQHGEVVVEETGRGRYQQSVRAGRHRLVADEPQSVGGDDTGPGPYELLLAGLGACTSMTIRMYAERKKLALERVRVVLSHDKIHAEDCEDCETKEGKVDRIQRTITLTGDLTEAERTRLKEIADRCPVHRTLESEIKVVTRLAEGA